MRCEVVEGARARPLELACFGCGCTEDHACEGGCWWVSFDPPLCSACAARASTKLDAGELEPGVYVGAEGGTFDQQRCPASRASALHIPFWIDDASGYCARCHTGFMT